MLNAVRIMLVPSLVADVFDRGVCPLKKDYRLFCILTTGDHSLGEHRSLRPLQALLNVCLRREGTRNYAFCDSLQVSFVETTLINLGTYFP